MANKLTRLSLSRVVCAILFIALSACIYLRVSDTTYTKLTVKNMSGEVLYRGEVTYVCQYSDSIRFTEVDGTKHVITEAVTTYRRIAADNKLKGAACGG